MSKIAFIFPGQGAQYTGMGRDFYEQTETGRKVFDQASELLGFSMPELVFEPNDRLDITEYTQAAMVTTSVAMMKVMEERGIHADVAAGLSLGEYCALVAAGVMRANTPRWKLPGCSPPSRPLSWPPTGAKPWPMRPRASTAA